MMAIPHATGPYATLVDGLSILVGIVVAFAGYRLARGLAGLAGFLAGFAVGLVVGAFFGPIGALVGAILGGILFAILFVVAFRFVGALLAGALAVGIGLALGWPPWALVLAAILGGILGLVANKLVIVMATAVEGAWLVATGGLGLFADLGRTVDNEELWLFGVAIVVGVAGILIQMRNLRGYED